MQVVKRLCDLQILADIAKSTFPADSHEMNLYLSMHQKQRNSMYVSTRTIICIPRIISYCQYSNDTDCVSSGLCTIQSAHVNVRDLGVFSRKF